MKHHCHWRTCLELSMMKAFFIVIGIVIILSILWATFRNALDTNLMSEFQPTRILRRNGQSQSQRQWPLLDAKTDNIFWIVQISDVHISKFRDLNRAPDLIQLCRDYLTVIRPQLVLITGDLTDAKDANDKTSRQHREEWLEYQQSIAQCKTLTTATILDTRGNHDAFDVSDVNGEDNFYRKYSEKGSQHALSYHHQHVTSFGTYSFIAVDACPVPGPRRPFNFFGHLNEERVKQLHDLDRDSRKSNLTLWFGHYPSSLIVQDPPGIRYVMRHGIAYLCGHLHTLGDMVTQMYTRHKTGTLELELGDWKINRLFRVLAVDHDLLSFVDAKLGEWPLILVTNPKDAHFLTPYHEPTESIKQSTHVRILVFSQSPVAVVDVYIDGIHVGQASLASDPLYTLPWNPELYSTGLHTLRVEVKDAAGPAKSVELPFSLDNSTPGFAFWPRFILMMNIFYLSKVLFGCTVFMYVLLLTSLRQFSSARCLFAPGRNWLWVLWNTWIFRLWLVARTGTIYYTLLSFILYITFGPWVVGEFVTNHTGVLFVWGTFVKGTFIPGSLTYFYGLFQVLTFNAPVTLILGAALDIRQQQPRSTNVPADWRPVGKRQIIMADILFLLLIIFQLFIAVNEFPQNYGTTAMIVSPVRLGSVLVAFLLLYFAHTAPIAVCYQWAGRG